MARLLLLLYVHYAAQFNYRFSQLIKINIIRMSLKNRLSTVQKELYNLTTNIKTYKRQTETLRQAKQAFQKAFDAKNADIRRTLTTELDRIHEQLKRHLTHHKSENARIKGQLQQLNTEKQNFQNYLKTIRQKLEQIERQIGESKKLYNYQRQDLAN